MEVKDSRKIVRNGEEERGKRRREGGGEGKGEGRREKGREKGEGVHVQNSDFYLNISQTLSFQAPPISQVQILVNE